MFSLPQAKRVRRDELQSPGSSPRSSPDPTIVDLFESRIQQDYTFEAAPAFAAPEEEAAASDDETELRLFAVSSAPSQKIRIKSPEAENREPGFIGPGRPRSYYFVDGTDEQRRLQFAEVAVDGETILKWAQKPWPGCVVPWKVKTIPGAGMKKAVLAGHPQITRVNGIKKKSRVGKKTRIARRKKAQGVKAKEEEAKRSAQEKEEAEREKRTKKNREKKVKQKAKAKAKKATEAAGTEVPAVDSGAIG